MKILTNGSGNPVKWWHQIEVECPACGRQMRLEPGDEMESFFIASMAEQIHIGCGRCFERITVTKPCDEV